MEGHCEMDVVTEMGKALELDATRVDSDLCSYPGCRWQTGWQCGISVMLTDTLKLNPLQPLRCIQRFINLERIISTGTTHLEGAEALATYVERWLFGRRLKQHVGSVAFMYE